MGKLVALPASRHFRILQDSWCHQFELLREVQVITGEVACHRLTNIQYLLIYRRSDMILDIGRLRFQLFHNGGAGSTSAYGVYRVKSNGRLSAQRALITNPSKDIVNVHVSDIYDPGDAGLFWNTEHVLSVLLAAIDLFAN